MFAAKGNAIMHNIGRLATGLAATSTVPGGAPMRVTRIMARTVAVVVLLATGATAAATQAGGATAGSSPGVTTTDDLLARLDTE